MTEHTTITGGEALPTSVSDSAAALEERLIQTGDPLPVFEAGDVICCQIRNRHDIFIVRQVQPLVVASVSRASRLNLGNELEGIRPIVWVRIPRLAETYPKAVEGGIYQLLTGQEIQVTNRSWVDVHNPGTPVKVGLIPRVIPRWLPEGTPPAQEQP